MQFIHAASFDNYIEANIILGRLTNEGINCWLKDEATVTVNPIWNQAVGGIKLMVAKQDMKLALPILQQLTGDRKEKTRCPKCTSLNVEYISSPKASNRFLAILSFFFTSYAVSAEKTYHCFDCGHEFAELPDT